ncbi:serine/threonine-protein kinase PknK [Haliangium ochraceum]|uniref:non-specific serine/threonine protein kinase n=1 Tax=Haliangium ochraceum (strain DSM 14365 / JCM 11303 / SMP-2) TaxID=502025 RepID=D0LZM3_HALO1|nr:protein kinase [Haliangium ochraceum]ACY18002.1 serine/threonine protein kinase [Haliangium ochraceum DSM 14365]
MAFTGTDRFELRGRLGEGGMGVVYEAYDHVRGMRVALKTLRRVRPNGLLRFKREFRAVRALGHPNIISLYELVSEGKQWFFTMELIEGTELLAHLRRPAPAPASASAQPSASTQTALDSLTEPALAADASETASAAATQRAARAGSDTRRDDDDDGAHFDTVLTEVMDNVPAAALADEAAEHERPHFAERVDHQRLREAFAQIVAGLHALHSAGMIHRDIKPSNILVTPEGRVVLMDFGIVADMRRGRALTAVGVIAGTPAFMAPEQVRGDALTPAADWYALGVILYLLLTGRLPFSGGRANMLYGKQILDALPPGRFTRDIPAQLEALCMGLLARDPEQRPGAGRVLEALGLEASRLGKRRHLGASERDHFVGRGDELAQLTRLYAEARGGPMRCVLVEGPSGIGKSRLLERFFGQLDSDPASAPVLLAGRCHERESLPYKAFDGVVDVLSQHLAALPEQVRRTSLPSGILLLTRLFPVLRRVPECDVTVTFGGNPAPMQARAMRALCELVATLARLSPIVIYIDDAQWIDRDSVDMLLTFLQQRDIADVLLIVSARDDSGRGHGDELARLQRAWNDSPACSRIALGPFSRDEQHVLIETLSAHRRGRGVGQEVWSELAGHPLLLAELARYITEDELGTITLDQPHLEDILWRRVQRSGASERAILEIVSLLGEPAPLRVVADAAGLSYGERERALTSLVSHQLVRVTRAVPEPWLDIYHTKLREAVCAHVQGEYARTLQRQISLALESWSEASPALRARHWRAAGEALLAARCLVAAARSAGEQLAHERADSLYRNVLDLLAGYRADEPSAESAGALLRCQAWIGLAQGQRRSGQIDAAMGSLERADQLARAHEFSPERADIHLARGALLAPHGEFEHGLREFAEACSLARQIGSPLREARALVGLGECQSACAWMHTASDTFSRCLELCRDHGFRDTAAAVLASRGSAGLYRLDLVGALRDGEEAIALARASAHTRAEALALAHCVGAVWLERGQLDSAEQACAHVGELARALGAPELEAFAELQRGKLLTYRQRPDEALEHVDRALRACREHGLARLAPSALAARARLLRDADERWRCLAEGEALLRAGGHHHLPFFRDALDAVLALGAHEHVEKYAQALERYTAREPLPWSRFFIARARLLSARARGLGDTDTLASMRGLHDYGRARGLHLAAAALAPPPDAA